MRGVVVGGGGRPGKQTGVAQPLRRLQQALHSHAQGARSRSRQLGAAEPDDGSQGKGAHPARPLPPRLSAWRPHHHPPRCACGPPPPPPYCTCDPPPPDPPPHTHTLTPHTHLVSHAVRVAAKHKVRSGAHLDADLRLAVVQRLAGLEHKRHAPPAAQCTRVGLGGEGWTFEVCVCVCMCPGGRGVGPLRLAAIPPSQAEGQAAFCKVLGASPLATRKGGSAPIYWFKNASISGIQEHTGHCR